MADLREIKVVLKHNPEVGSYARDLKLRTLWLHPPIAVLPDKIE